MRQKDHYNTLAAASATITNLQHRESNDNGVLQSNTSIQQVETITSSSVSTNHGGGKAPMDISAIEGKGRRMQRKGQIQRRKTRKGLRKIQRRKTRKGLRKIQRRKTRKGLRKIQRRKTRKGLPKTQRRRKRKGLRRTQRERKRIQRIWQRSSRTKAGAQRKKERS